MTTYIALFNLTDAGIKAAKDSPRRLDAAKKLLTDMGGEMKQFYMVMGEFDFVRICEGRTTPSLATLRPAAWGPRLRANEDAEGVPGDRLPRNHPLARLSRVACSWRCASPVRAIATSSCGSSNWGWNAISARCVSHGTGDTGLSASYPGGRLTSGRKTRVYWFRTMPPRANRGTADQLFHCWRRSRARRRSGGTPGARGAGLSSRPVRELARRPFWSTKRNRSLWTARCNCSFWTVGR